MSTSVLDEINRLIINLAKRNDTLEEMRSMYQYHYNDKIVERIQENMITIKHLKERRDEFIANMHKK